MEVLYTSSTKKKYWLDKDGLEIHRFLSYMDPALQLSAREYMPEQSMVTNLKEQGYTRDTELITEEMVTSAIGKYFDKKLAPPVVVPEPQIAYLPPPVPPARITLIEAMERWAPAPGGVTFVRRC